MNADHLASFLDSVRRILTEQGPDEVLGIDIRLRGRCRSLFLATPRMEVHRDQRKIVASLLDNKVCGGGPMYAWQIAARTKLACNSYFRRMLADLILFGCIVQDRGRGYVIVDELPEWFVRQHGGIRVPDTRFSSSVHQSEGKNWLDEV